MAATVSQKRCVVCDGPVEPGKRENVCSSSECRSSLARWLVGKTPRAKRSRQESLTGVRVCCECGVSKPLTSQYFQVNNRGPDGRVWYRRMCWDCYRPLRAERNRQWRKRVRKDRKRHAQILADARMRQNRPLTGKKREAPAGDKDISQRIYPVEPLARWLEVVAAKEECDLRTLAVMLRSHERRLHGILKREYATSDIYAADALLTRYGRPVDVDGVTVRRVEDLWPALDA